MRLSIEEPQTPELGLHEPFLEMAGTSGDQISRDTARAAFLTLRVVDRLAGAMPSYSPESVEYQIRAATEFVAKNECDPETASLFAAALAAAGNALDDGDTREIWPPLIRFGRTLEGELRLNEALDVYETLLGLDSGHEDEAMTRIWRARALRLAGRLDDSLAEYRVAGTVARSIGFAHADFRSRLGQASTHKKKGNLPEAERLAKQVIDEARLSGDRLMEAMALHSVGDCLMYEGRDCEAIPLLFAAFEIYEHKADRTRALSDLGIALKNLGQFVASKHAFSLALRDCATAGMRINTMLELLEVAALIDDSKAFADWKSELDAVRDVMQPDATVDFYIKMGQGLSMFGDVDEALICLRKAISLAENYDLNTYLFRAGQLLERLEEPETESRGTSPQEGGAHPEIQYVAQQLEVLHVGVTGD